MTVNGYKKCLLMSGWEKDKSFKNLFSNKLKVSVLYLYMYMSFKQGFKALQILKNHADYFPMPLPHS